MNDDRRSLQLALYGAAAQAEDASTPVTVAIRYLTDGRTEAVPGASRLLERHKDRPRIPVVLVLSREGDFPPAPRAEAECLRCPFVFVCPR